MSEQRGIEERLRHLAKLLGVGSFDIPTILVEAADEIGRLKAIAIERMDLFRQAANNVERLDAEIASARKTLEVVKSMIHGEALEHAVVDTSTMTTLGEIVETSLSVAIEQRGDLAWTCRPVSDMDEARSAWLKASVDASSLTDDYKTTKGD